MTIDSNIPSSKQYGSKLRDIVGLRSTEPTKLLVFSSSVLDQKVYKLLLAPLGYQIEHVLTVEDVLIKVEQSTLDLLIIDTPLLDLGQHLCTQVRILQRDGYIPILMLSDWDAHVSLIQALQIGADEFLHKPFNLHEFLARAQTLLKIKSLQSELIKKNNEIGKLQEVIKNYATHNMGDGR